VEQLLSAILPEKYSVKLHWAIRIEVVCNRISDKNFKWTSNKIILLLIFHCEKKSFPCIEDYLTVR
jgi:hypothetical protein